MIAQSLSLSQFKQTIFQRDAYIYYIFIFVMLFFAVVLHDTAFLTVSNFMNIVKQTAPLTIMAVGLTFALAVGHIDLSIGSTVALSALVGALLLQYTGIPLAVLGALSVGVIIGLVNGFLIERLQVSSLLITLGTMGIVTGIARQLTNLESVPIINQDFNFIFGAGNIFNIPVLLIWTIAIGATAYIVLNKLAAGRHILAVGGNPSASRAMGLKVTRIRIYALLASSTAAALAGLLYAGRLHGARYTLGEADLLTVIAAVAIGGTSLFGGRACIIGAILGSWLMGMINNGLILSGFSTNEQMIARGVILIIAVAIGVKELRNG